MNQPFEIVGSMSPSQAQTALGAGMKRTAIMWNPLNPRGQSAPLRLSDPGILETDGQRAAVLDCYEEVAPESIEMSAHLKPRRCTGGSGLRGR